MTTLISGLGGPAGFGENVVPSGDFQFSTVDLRPVFGRGLTLFGITYAQLFVNSTGSVSFGASSQNVNLGALGGATGIPVFAPFIADAVTYGDKATSPGGLSTGAGRVWYDLDADSHSLTVTWDDVRGFFTQAPLTHVNAFQLRITGVPDASGAYDGDFNVEYRYETIAWTTGNEQGGSTGLGGSPARAGYGAGNGRDYLELPASGDQAALLALDTATNIAEPGRFLFQASAGRIAPVFSADSVRVAEGSAGAPGEALVTVRLSTPLAVAATVRYDLAPVPEGAFVSAVPFEDYVPRSGVLTFAPGLTTQTVRVELAGDDLPEGEEHFTFVLSEPSAGASAISGTIAIPANDGAPEMPIVLVSDAQASESAGTIDFVLRLPEPQAEAVSGFYVVSFQEDTTASQDDVTLPEFGTVSFAPGQTEVTVSVPVLPDTIVEGPEQFFLNFVIGAGGATIARGTIRDDDGFSVSDAAVTEADTTFVTFTVTLPAPLTEKATVFYGTSSGTAVAGQDYAGTTGELTFAPGVTSQTVEILVFDDSTAEADEQFSLVLSSPSANTSIADGKGIASVTDDDGISIADFSVAEGTTNKFSPVFMTLTLPQASKDTVSVDFQVEAGTGDANSDISPNGHLGTITFAPGQTKASIAVSIAGDSLPEPDETIRVVLSNPVGSTISDGSGTLTILNDDGVAPLVAGIASQTVSEGNDTGIQQVPVTVFLNRLSTLPVTVTWLLVGDDAGGGTASPGSDFVQSAGTTTIPAGKLSATFDVIVMRNATVEPDETLTLRVSKITEGVAPGLAGPDGILTIANDDTTFSLSYDRVFASEGVWAAAPLNVTVTRAGDLSQEQFVGWEIPLDSQVTAVDFAATSGIVGFAAGQETATFTVTVIDDATVEPFENFSIALPLLPAGGLAGPGVGTAIGIRNDDTRIRLFAPPAPFNQLENGAGFSEPRFQVAVDGNLTVARNVTWTITGNGATPATADDFTAMTGTLFIPGQAGVFNGEASFDLLIPIIDDSAIEPAEGYTVTLSDAGPGATIETPSVSAVIRNDDIKATLSAAKASQAEGSGGGTTAFAFTVTLDPAPPRPSLFSSFSWTVGAGTAPGTVSASAADFANGVLPTGTFTMNPDQAAATILVPVAADTAAELNESFTLTLFDNATGLAVGKATATILNDDTNLSIAATSANKPEGSGPAPTPYTFTVTRTGDLSKATTAKWSAAGTAGTGTTPANAADFPGGVLPSGTVSFAAGQKTQLITVNVAADRAVESNERFAVTLSAPSAGASITTASAGAIIQNDDKAGTGTLAIARLRAARSEGQSGSTDFTFQLTRTGTSTGVAAVDWTVAGGGVAGTGGTAAGDFAAGVLPAGSVTFAAGEIARTITIPVKGDTAAELNESFTVTLGNASQGVALGTASATGLVWNDDTAGTGTLSIARLAAQKAEGASGTAAFTFTVSRTGTLTGTASADWGVTGGGVAGTGAASGADFAGGQLPSGRVSFVAGQASAVVTVTVAGDTAAELNESFTITLSGAQAGVSLGTATATGAILNDDFASTGGNETLNGTTGPDVFLLGGGVDSVFGKGGIDRFLFGPAALGDGVTNGSVLGDFDGLGGEKLDLSQIDAIAGAGTANDAFSFIGTAAFTAPGQLRWEDLGTARGIFGNVDADATPELVIYLAAAGPVQQGWIIL